MVDQSLPSRVSALAERITPVSDSGAGVTLTEIPDLTLWQLAAWPESIDRLSKSVAGELGLSNVPGFGQTHINGSVSMHRVEPLKFWIIGAAPGSCEASDGAVLDMSHSRTHIRLSGAKADTVLNSFLPLDLREQSFTVGTIASTAFHHVGVTLWRSDQGFELFVPRGFAVSLWELLVEASGQYRLAIV